MVVTKVSSYSDFVDLKEDWNGLLETSEERENVFLRHEWFDVWWQAFGKAKDMLILLCHDEKDAIIGIAPLMIFRDSYKGLNYNRLGFIEDPNAPSMNFIAKQGNEETIIFAMLDHLFSREKRDWHVAVLNKIASSSITISICQSFFSRNRTNFLLRNGQNSPYIPTHSNWETFFGSRSVRFRKQFRNKVNKLNNAGEVSFQVWDNIGKEAKHLRDAMSVSSRSWKHEEGTSMSSTPERRKFFELLSDVASRNGWLRIWLLSLNGDPIATEYHLEYKGRTHAMRGDFDQSQDAFSPGSVLEGHIIEQCFKNGLLEYDFCGLPFGYKLRWTELLHKRENILFYNDQPYSLGLYVLQKYFPIIKRNLLKTVKIVFRKSQDSLR